MYKQKKVARYSGSPRVLAL
jgi:hypothetical protein